MQMQGPLLSMTHVGRHKKHHRIQIQSTQRQQSTEAGAREAEEEIGNRGVEGEEMENGETEDGEIEEEGDGRVGWGGDQ